MFHRKTWVFVVVCHTRDKEKSRVLFIEISKGPNSPFSITSPSLRCVDGAQLTHGSQDCAWAGISLVFILREEIVFRRVSWPTDSITGGGFH